MLFPQQNSIRRQQKLDGIWSFQTDPRGEGESLGWPGGLPAPRQIAVPGSWNEQLPDLAGYFGLAWYETAFFADAAWDGFPLRLRIGAASNNVRVWVNGAFAGGHRGPYLPADLDVTGLVKFGAENRLTVCVDALLDPWMFPPASLAGNEGRAGFTNTYPAVAYDFFPYGGIHRSVSLYATGVPRIERIAVTTAALRPGEAEIDVEVELGGDFSGTVTCSVEGIEARFPCGGGRIVTGKMNIPSPRLWEIGKGELYLLEVRAEDRDGRADLYRQTFGIRTVEVKGDAFLLNGQPVFFKGFGKHEDFHIVGKGHLPPLVVRDFENLRWLGANSFRTSHYPYAEEWLDYADRAGIMVIDEGPFVGLGDRMYTDEILAKAKGVVAELIRRDQCHPCVVMWSLANEPNCSAGNAAATNFFKEMAGTARALDPGRPITYVAHRDPENNEGLKYYDVVCINKYYGWYMGSGRIEETLPEFEECLESFHKAFGKPVILAEFGADAIDGMHRLPAEMFTEEFQSDIIERQYGVLRAKPWCIGAHVWAFADFKTSQTISRIVFNRKGVFTRDRQPKMAAHTLRRLWREA